jgi:hypothetical protein
MTTTTEHAMTFDIGAEIAKENGNRFATAATVATQRYQEARERFALLCGTVMELEAERPIQKSAAVLRIMGEKGLAATPAEKLAESDGEYAAFLKRQRQAVVSKELAYGQAESAKQQHATALALLALSEVV